MNPGNFVVRSARRWVEKYGGLEAWLGLDRAGADVVAEHLSGLPAPRCGMTTRPPSDSIS